MQISMLSYSTQQFTTQSEDGGWENHVIHSTWAQSFLFCLAASTHSLEAALEAKQSTSHGLFALFHMIAR
jgi:hypothetical protein